MSQATRANLNHGPLRRIARDGLRHGHNAFRPDRDCAETLVKVCSMQRPLFVQEPDEVQKRMYLLAFISGWASAREIAK